MSTMVEGDAPGNGEVVTMFRLPASIEAEQVHVVGEFNDWSTTANPMERDDDGFVAHIPLEKGRSYRFRYLLDGDRWENDWQADAYVPNEFGGDDSVIDLTDHARPAQNDGATEAAAPAKPKRTRKKAAPKASG